MVDTEVAARTGNRPAAAASAMSPRRLSRSHGLFIGWMLPSFQRTTLVIRSGARGARSMPATSASRLPGSGNASSSSSQIQSKPRSEPARSPCAKPPGPPRFSTAAAAPRPRRGRRAARGGLIGASVVDDQHLIGGRVCASSRSRHVRQHLRRGCTSAPARRPASPTSRPALRTRASRCSRGNSASARRSSAPTRSSTGGQASVPRSRGARAGAARSTMDWRSCGSSAGRSARGRPLATGERRRRPLHEPGDRLAAARVSALRS